MPQSSSSHDFSKSCHSTNVSGSIARALRVADLSESSENSGRRSNEETSSDILRRCLSTISAGLTFPGLVRRAERLSMGAVVGAPRKEDFKIIGMGSCGTVYEIPGTGTVVKKGRDGMAIYNDFLLTRRVYHAVEKVRGLLRQEFPGVAIPQCPDCRDFYAADDETFWTDGLNQRFPADRRVQEPVFLATRILPLPKLVRDALVELFFDESESVQEEAKDDQDNRDCLVRVYLGEREPLAHQNDCYDTLRNFEMRLNMMEDIGLDLIGLASEMAIGLAIIHWQAQVDAMDSEFVLGSCATWDKIYGVLEKNEGTSLELIDFQQREIHLWMLDFDKASVIDLTEQDVEKRLVPAFVGNDPYFPLPSVNDDDDKVLWEAFSATYLKASRVILDAKFAETGRSQEAEEDRVMRLPKRFLEKVEERVQENAEWDAEDHIIFA